MSENYYLAVDGGGTKTLVWCADAEGSVVGTGQSGPTNLTATSVGAASFNLNEAIRQATQILPEGAMLQRLVMGLAGLDSDQEQTKAEQLFGEVVHRYGVREFVLVNDTVIALASGSLKPNAVVLIAGTGSNCYGRNESGQTTKVGGMDYLLTDQGSGYMIGRQVLRDAVRSFDGRLPKTILEELVCEHFSIESIADLKDAVYNPLLPKARIAEVAQLASKAYEQGDENAIAIFDKAVADLTEMVTTVVRKLGLENQPVDVVLAGSVATLDHIKERLIKRLDEADVDCSIIVPDQPPVYGALQLALGRQASNR